MLCSHDGTPHLWLALGPGRMRATIAPLLDHHAKTGESRFIVGTVEDIDSIAHTFDGRHATLLVLEDPDKASLRPRYASPFVKDATGELLLGWLHMNERSLAAYAKRAVELQNRSQVTPQTLCLLGPREDRYLKLVDEVEVATAKSKEFCSFRWTAERIRRTPMVQGLRAGFGAILFTGYGTALGWIAYGGVDISVLCAAGEWRTAESCAALFSLSCGTGAAGAPGRETGFSDLAISCGVAGVIFAPQDKTPHDNTRLLAPALASALAQGKTELWQILADARNKGASLRNYVVIGDPALSVGSAANADKRAAMVFAPAPNYDFAGACDALHIQTSTISTDAVAATKGALKPNRSNDESVNLSELIHTDTQDSD